MSIKQFDSTGHLRCIELRPFLVILTISSFILPRHGLMLISHPPSFLHRHERPLTNQWLELEPKNPPIHQFEKKNHPNQTSMTLGSSRSFSHRIHVDWHVISHRITCMFTSLPTFNLILLLLLLL